MKWIPIFFYFLDDHPDAMQYVVKRIVITKDEGGKYSWHPEALEKPASRCCPVTPTGLRDFDKWCYGDHTGP